ncbi:MAG: hypothetical protein AAFV86_14680, partial [Pseudomonadota bacterium]
MAQNIVPTTMPGALPGPFEALAGLRNTALDTATYDTARLTGEERRVLSRGTGAPGSILVVGPKGAGGIRRFATHGALRAAPGPVLTQIAVAGMGASETGAAALARTLADVTGRPAGAVVAGYTREDALVEALGGGVLFAAAQRARQAVGTLRRRLVEMAVETAAPGRRAALGPDSFAVPAVATLARLMADRDRRLDLVVGHARGALLLSAAFALLARTAPAEAVARAARAQVVTAGAAVAFPEPVQWVHQVIGALDPLGRLNAEDGV